MIKVIKFGGTSLRDKESRHKAINIIKKIAEEHKVVVVVSAMGRYDDAYATDTLAKLIRNFVSPKEKDRLLSIGEIISSIVLCDELIAEGTNATSLSIYKTGIKTDMFYNQASVESVDSTYLLEMLEKYDVIIVPGFQGVNKDNEITTLGRGGSDYSAVILANALKLNEVCIYSDVCGIYSCDPHKIEHTKLLENISFIQALEIARYKSNVINERAILYGAKYQIDIRLKSTFNDKASTLIQAESTNNKALCFYQSYDRIIFDEIIDKNDIHKLNYILEDDTFMIESDLLNQLSTPYTLLGKHTMVHFVGDYKNLKQKIETCINRDCYLALNDKKTYFIPLKNTQNMVQKLHDDIVLEE